MSTEQTEGWRRDAACQDSPGNLFFPVSYRDITGLTQTYAAKRICAACPVQRRCLDFIVQDEATRSYPQWYGIYGGLTPAERYEFLHGAPPGRSAVRNAARNDELAAA